MCCTGHEVYLLKLTLRFFERCASVYVYVIYVITCLYVYIMLQCLYADVYDCMQDIYIYIHICLEYLSVMELAWDSCIYRDVYCIIHVYLYIYIYVYIYIHIVYTLYT